MIKRSFFYVGLGLLFGLTLAKSEAISWFRIQEMFRFDSFHMYGIMGSAVVTGVVLVQVLRRMGLRTWQGEHLPAVVKTPSIVRYALGGSIFGIGWALTGACPGPLYILVGHGMMVYLLVILAAVIGTLLYGVLRPRLPH
jgi:uncharacterized protein